ncbi:MAG: YbjN domain-containing protein [Deltaproteobacteria bacterium]|nr:YbjN domain-containing protein [Deltaproteobacteria bacterium]
MNWIPPNKNFLVTVAQFFVKDDWNIEQIADSSAFAMWFGGKNGTWACLARVSDGRNLFAFYSIFTTNVPEERRTAVADLLTRINYGLPLGNFELDFADGEIRFKTSIDIQGGTLTFDMWKTVVYVNVFTMDMYFPALTKVVEGTTTPEQALADIEKSQEK